MTSIAYVGNFQPEWSTENDVRLALEELGCEVVCLQENRVSTQTIMDVASGADLLLWTGTWDNAHDPLVVRTMVHELTKLGVQSATYHLDTFWPLARGGRQWWNAPMFQMAHVLTADGDWDAEFHNSGIRHRWLRAGVRHTACQPGQPQSQFMCDVALVGSNGAKYHDEWPYRAELAKQLQAMCRRNGWSYRNPGGSEPKVDRGSMNDFYASAKVTVGDSLCIKQESSCYWSDRAYEATGRHGLLIMPEIYALRDDFDDMLPMYPWGDWAELEVMIRSHLEDGQFETSQSYCAAITERNHTYVNRMTTLLKAVL